MRRLLCCGSCGLRWFVSIAILLAVVAGECDRMVCLPKLLRPKSLPCLVDEDGGGGVSICDAVGARDWRIEYVRCILGIGCGWTC